MVGERVTCSAHSLDVEKGVFSCHEPSEYVIMTGPEAERQIHCHSCHEHLADVIASFHNDHGCPVFIITEECDAEPCEPKS